MSTLNAWLDVLVKVFAILGGASVFFSFSGKFLEFMIKWYLLVQSKKLSVNGHQRIPKVKHESESDDEFSFRP